jgi:hypothetical protein
VNVAALLQSNAVAIAELHRRFDLQNDARALQQKERDKLVGLGIQKEQEKNRSLLRRLWGWAISTFGIGGLIALCVLCPAMIPILGRLLAWVVGKIPALAGAIGVVSTKAYDATVRGLENAKADFARHNDGTQDVAVLHSNLSQAMDRSHKALVKRRKLAVIP